MKLLLELFVALVNGVGALLLFTLTGGFVGGLGGLLVAMMETSKGGIEKLGYTYAMQGAGCIGIIGALFGLLVGCAAFMMTLQMYDDKRAKGGK